MQTFNFEQTEICNLSLLLLIGLEEPLEIMKHDRHQCRTPDSSECGACVGLLSSSRTSISA